MKLMIHRVFISRIAGLRGLIYGAGAAPGPARHRAIWAHRTESYGAHLRLELQAVRSGVYSIVGKGHRTLRTVQYLQLGSSSCRAAQGNATRREARRGQAVLVGVHTQLSGYGLSVFTGLQSVHTPSVVF